MHSFDVSSLVPRIRGSEGFNFHEAQVDILVFGLSGRPVVIINLATFSNYDSRELSSAIKERRVALAARKGNELFLETHKAHEKDIEAAKSLLNPKNGESTVRVRLLSDEEADQLSSQLEGLIAELFPEKEPETEKEEKSKNLSTNAFENPLRKYREYTSLTGAKNEVVLLFKTRLSEIGARFAKNNSEAQKKLAAEIAIEENHSEIRRAAIKRDLLADRTEKEQIQVSDAAHELRRAD